MPERKDDGVVTSQEAHDVVVLSRDEYDRLLASADGGGVNTEPAVESGPHLDDPEIARLKAQQLRDAGWDHDHPKMNDDMRKVLKKHGGT